MDISFGCLGFGFDKSIPDQGSEEILGIEVLFLRSSVSSLSLAILISITNELESLLQIGILLQIDLLLEDHLLNRFLFSISEEFGILLGMSWHSHLLFLLVRSIVVDDQLLELVVDCHIFIIRLASFSDCLGDALRFVKKVSELLPVV